MTVSSTTAVMASGTSTAQRVPMGRLSRSSRSTVVPSSTVTRDVDPGAVSSNPHSSSASTWAAAVIRIPVG